MKEEKGRRHQGGNQGGNQKQNVEEITNDKHQKDKQTDHAVQKTKDSATRIDKTLHFSGVPKGSSYGCSLRDPVISHEHGELVDSLFDTGEIFDNYNLDIPELIMEDGTVTIDEWAKLWKDGKTDFHISELCNMFTKHVDKMLNNREQVKTFVPLCGKAVEMKWLWDKGHEVVGIECGEEALKEFFEENTIGYSIVEVPELKGKLYKSDDGKIRLYCCDFYLFNAAIESGFGAVWDSGALNAINLTDQEKYVAIIKSLMGNKCVNLTVIDDATDWEIPVNFDKMRTWFKDEFSVEASDYVKADEKLQSFGIKGQQLYTISKI